ncbi:MAG: 50S ribosomal protein L4 [Mycoplasmatota bacterium]|nr:50S ribosomal protein L4 [Mycoplasmatota bacterium]
MSKIELLNNNGEKVKDIKLNDNVFGIAPNDIALKDALVLYMASTRQGTHSTKTRAEVSGGGRKPWRQKGTGNARQGSIRAVQWRKGGIAFGPKPRDYSKKQNRKVRRLALKSALSYKVLDNELIMLENIKFETNKTKEMVALLDKLQLTNSKVLIVVDELEDNICLASRNLGNVKIVLPEEVNVYDVVNSDKMIMTEASLKKLEEVLANE